VARRNLVLSIDDLQWRTDSLELLAGHARADAPRLLLVATIAHDD